jgi:hypoxanthine-DNA glycosylase
MVPSAGKFQYFASAASVKAYCITQAMVKRMSEPAEHLVYSFDPICNESSRVLILGTMASPASLRAGMYYAHPRNAFWRILSELTGDELPASNEAKRIFLLRHGIALWDTLKYCEREGAADSAIRREMPNDIVSLLIACPRIKAVFLNGGAAYGYYQKYHAGQIELPFNRLPSTSPANARGGLLSKIVAWQAVTGYLI